MLWRTHEQKDAPDSYDEIKMIGMFSTEQLVQTAIERLKNPDGFRDYPNFLF